MPSKLPLRALHPSTQSQDRDARIVAALERVGEVLRNQAWDTGRTLSMGPLHVQILGHLHARAANGILAVDLATHFHLSKPTMSVALRTLADMGAVRAVPSKVDGRAKVIVLTQAGRRKAEQAAAHLDGLLPLLATLPEDARAGLYEGLYRLLDLARTAGVVRADRMCTTCAHYGSRHGKPHCTLLGKPLSQQEHRVDCAEHVAA